VPRSTTRAARRRAGPFRTQRVSRAGGRHLPWQLCAHESRPDVWAQVVTFVSSPHWFPWRFLLAPATNASGTRQRRASPIRGQSAD